MKQAFRFLALAVLLLGLLLPAEVRPVEAEDLPIDSVTEPSGNVVYLPLIQNHTKCTTIPTLLYPKNGEALNTISPLFQVNLGNDPDATYMTFELSTDVGFNSIAMSVGSYSATGVYENRFPWNLDPATVYYWRAKIYCGSINGPYSDTFSFSTPQSGTLLPAPSLISPSNGKALSSWPINFQWYSVGGALDYYLFVREPGSEYFYFYIVNGTQVLNSDYYSSTQYEWWVQARNNYALGNPSALWNFTTPSSYAGFSSESEIPNVISIEKDGSTTTFERR